MPSNRIIGSYHAVQLRYSGYMDSRISARALSAALGGWRTREPAYEALADGIRLLCLDNRVAPRTALPAERELAAALRVSRSTVAAAYRSLRDSGHISSTRGSGSVTLPLRRRDPGRASTNEGANRPAAGESSGLARTRRTDLGCCALGIDDRLEDRLRRSRADRAARSDRRAGTRSAASRPRRMRSSSRRAHRARSTCSPPCCSAVAIVCSSRRRPTRMPPTPSDARAHAWSACR